MIRVLFVSTSTTLGGAEKTLYTLATLLDPQKFKVVGVVSLKPLGGYARRLEAAGIPVFSLDADRRASFQDVGRLARIIHETGPDLVHAVMYQAIQLTRLVKRLKKTSHGFKLVSSPRVNYRTRSFLSLAVDRLLKSGDDLLVAESKASRDFLVNRMGYSPDKTRTIYNGVDIAGWPISKLDRQQKRLELRLGAGELLIGTTGRLDEQKGHKFLIDAMARIKDTPARCVILGEGPARKLLEERIRKLRLEKQVLLLGECSDITSWLSAFDVFVLPSLWEGLPNSLLEAMAVGLPVVASSVDGVCEVIRDGQNGFLAAPKSSKALAQRLVELLRDPALRSRLGASAKETVVDKFNLAGMIAAYEDAYSRLAAA